MILYSEGTVATYKLLDISLEYDGIFQEPHSIRVLELYTGTTAISYTKLTSIHYETLSKKTPLGKLRLATCRFIYYKAYWYYFLVKKLSLRTETKNFTTLTAKKF